MANAPSAVLAPHHGYHIDVRAPHDSDIPHEKRNRAVRRLVLLAGVSIMSLGPTLAGGLYGKMLGYHQAGLLVGALAGIIICGKYLPNFFVSNDEWSSYLTQDMLGDEMVPYGPGLSAALPWESRDKSHNYSLKVTPDSVTVAVQTKSAKVTAVVSYEYQRDLANLDISIGTSNEDVKKALEPFISSFLTERLSEIEARDAVKRIHWLNTELSTAFMRHADGTLGQFEAKSGFRIVSVVVASLALPPDVQATRDAIDEAEALHEVTAEMFGMKKDVLAAKILDGSITHERHMEMMNRALAVSKNGVKLDIKAWEVNLPGPVIDMLERLATKFTK